MRIRSIRPEFWSSEDIAAMDWFTRLVYIGLWSYVDDNGVGRDIERLIVTDLFPLDEDLRESSRRVTGALRHLSDRGHVTRYEVDGKRYLHIVKWTTHQRIEKASKGRYPLPTCENAEITEPSPTTPGTLPDMSAPGEGEKGRRGEGEKSSSASADADRGGEQDRFDEFWNVYGKKLDRKRAEQKWRTALKKPGVTADVLIAAARTYIADQVSKGKHPEYTKHADAWLNGECWNDEIPSNVHQLRTDEQGRTILPPPPGRSPWGP